MPPSLQCIIGTDGNQNQVKKKNFIETQLLVMKLLPLKPVLCVILFLEQLRKEKQKKREQNLNSFAI